MSWMTQPRDSMGRFTTAEAAEEVPGWGDGELMEEGEGVPGELDLGGGSSLTLSPEQMYELLRSPEVMALLDLHGQELAEKANQMATTEGALYTYTVQANEGYETPQVFLHPANFQAKIDDAAHSTLLKVAATMNEDIPIGTGEEEEVWVPIGEPDFEDYRLPSGRSIWSKAEGR